jgi:peptide/nickel transport system substrate-binding protein
MNLGRIAGLLILALSCAAARADDAVKNPDTYVHLTVSDADSMDPAWAYDTVSSLIQGNVYENLFFFEGTSTEKLVPFLASKVPTKENGLISADGLTYRIPIRTGVRFHDGSVMTPEDVRYSILRFLLQDRSSGPSALLLEPLLGYTSTRDEKGALNPAAFRDATRAVSLDGGTLVLKLPHPFAPLLSVLASWCPVVSKSWAVKHGDWDGTEATWARFNNPSKESSPFFEKVMGTGPFALERWDRKAKEFVLTRHDGYWRAPAKLKRVLIKDVPEFGTRKLMLQAGDADSIQEDRSQFTQLHDLPGVTLFDDLPILSMDPMIFFNFKINVVGNPYVGSGRLDGAGIPSDFFADKEVRRGIAYALDYAGYIKDVFRGKGTQATGCVPKSLPGYSASQPTYRLDLEEAKKHFQKAFGGQVWEKGFHFTLTYGVGRSAHQILCQMLKRNLESLNPKFQVDVRPMDWPAFLDASRSGKLPLPVMRWGGDYPDPHDFAFPLMHSKGTYPSLQHYSNPEADRLIEAAIRETRMARRKELYRRLIALEHDDLPHLVVIDQAVFHTQRSWVRGWRYNPIYPDAPYGGYFYPLSKSATGS